MHATHARHTCTRITYATHARSHAYVWPSKVTSTELPHLLYQTAEAPLPVYYSQALVTQQSWEDVDSVLILRRMGERADVGESFNWLELGLWPAASTAPEAKRHRPPHICLPSSQTLNAAGILTGKM